MIDRYADLAIAIIEQAKRDYKNALQGKRTKEKEKYIKDCETFFLSEWGQSLTFWNGEFVIERCRREVAQAKERKRLNGRS